MKNAFEMKLFFQNKIINIKKKKKLFNIKWLNQV